MGDNIKWPPVPTSGTTSDSYSGGVDVATAVLLASIAAIEMMGIRINDQADDIQSRIDEVKHLRELKNLLEEMSEVEMEQNNLIEDFSTEEGTITHIMEDGETHESKTQILTIELKSGHTIVIEKAAEDGVQYVGQTASWNKSEYTFNSGDIIAVAILGPDQEMEQSKTLDTRVDSDVPTSVETTNSLLGLQDDALYFRFMGNGEKGDRGSDTGAFVLSVGGNDVYFDWNQESNDLEIHIKSPDSMFGASLMISDGDFTASPEVEMHTELGFEDAKIFYTTEQEAYFIFPFQYDEINDSIYNEAANEIIEIMNTLAEKLDLNIEFEEGDLESVIDFLNSEFDADIDTEAGESFFEVIQEFTEAMIEEISDRISDLLGENQIEMLYLQKDLSTMVFYIQLASNIMSTYYKDGLSTIARNM